MMAASGDKTGDARRMPPAQPVLRFAPSPNGFLHLGHALSALTNQAMAERLGGRLLLRIEDIDIGRTRPEFVEAIFSDLAWLGLSWETPVLRQSEQFAVYAEAAAKLGSMGLLYPCFATRAEIAAASDPAKVDPDGAPLYPGLHRGLALKEISRRRALGQPFAMRLDMAKAMTLAGQMLQGEPLRFTALNAALEPRRVDANPERWGDVVIQRKEVPTSYHLSVVVDDARQGITHVVRGQDLCAATDLHRLLQVLLLLPEPLYHHHRLLLGSDGRKLSKSRGDTSIRGLRRAGATAASIRAELGFSGCDG